VVIKVGFSGIVGAEAGFFKGFSSGVAGTNFSNLTEKTYSEIGAGTMSIYPLSYYPVAEYE
jgi:hypothetical protein